MTEIFQQNPFTITANSSKSKESKWFPSKNEEKVMHCVWQLIALILSWNIFMFVCLQTPFCFYRMKQTNKPSNSSDDDGNGCVALWNVEKCVNLSLNLTMARTYVGSVDLSGCANVEIPLTWHRTSPTSWIEWRIHLCADVFNQYFNVSIEKLYQNRLAWFCTTIYS